MAALLPQPIEWIDLAPVCIEARAESAASPEAVFAVLADHERWPEWFPAVRKVSVLGAASGVGARRRVVVPGLAVDEEFIVWDPGVRWAFTGYAARPRFTRSLVEDCRLSRLPTGGTAMTYSMYLDPHPSLRVLVAAARHQVSRNIGRALTNLSRRAESG